MNYIELHYFLMAIIPWVTAALTIGNVILCKSIWKIQSDRIKLLYKEIDNAKWSAHDYVTGVAQNQDVRIKKSFLEYALEVRNSATKKELVDEIERLEVKIKTLHACFDQVIEKR